jgi:hypothetical protein
MTLKVDTKCEPEDEATVQVRVAEARRALDQIEQLLAGSGGVPVAWSGDLRVALCRAGMAIDEAANLLTFAAIRLRNARDQRPG